jgi:hypothetical protein
MAHENGPYNSTNGRTRVHDAHRNSPLSPEPMTQARNGWEESGVRASEEEPYIVEIDIPKATPCARKNCQYSVHSGMIKNKTINKVDPQIKSHFGPCESKIRPAKSPPQNIQKILIRHEPTEEYLKGSNPSNVRRRTRGQLMCRIISLENTK